jgi:hypothetical protein
MVDALRTFAGANAAAMDRPGSVDLTAGVVTASNIAATSAALLDATDPDTLISFFQKQIGDARASLSTMMTAQDTRTQQIGDLQSSLAVIQKFEDAGITPSDPNWSEFKQAADNIVTTLSALPAGSGSKAAADITNALNAATRQQTVAQNPTAASQAMLTEIGKSPLNTNPIMISYNNPNKLLPAAGMKGQDIKSLEASVKSVTDQMQADSSTQMIRVQQQVDQITQYTNTCSNILKKLADAQNNSIGNLR